MRKDHISKTKVSPWDALITGSTFVYCGMQIIGKKHDVSYDKNVRV